MRANVAMTRTMNAYRMEMVHSLFNARIQNRRFLPGREQMNEADEKIREKAEFESIEDYIEQA